MKQFTFHNKIVLKIINYLAFPVPQGQEILEVRLSKDIEFILKNPISLGCGTGEKYFMILGYVEYFKRTLNLLKHKFKGDYK